MTGRCPSRCPSEPLPAGLPVETARVHPRYKHLLEPGAQCELPAGHGGDTHEHDLARRHRSGLLLWWAPPVFVTGGERS